MNIIGYISNVVHANKKIATLQKKLDAIRIDNADLVKKNDDLLARVAELDGKLLVLNSKIERIPTLAPSIDRLGALTPDAAAGIQSIDNCINCPDGKKNTTYICPFCSPEKEVFLCGRHYQGHLLKFHSDDNILKFRPDDYGGSITYPKRD